MKYLNGITRKKERKKEKTINRITMCVYFLRSNESIEIQM